MAARGFAYRAGPARLPAAPDDEPALIDLARRQADGYGVASPKKTAGPPSSPDPPPGYDSALFGPPGTKVGTGIGGGYRVPSQGCEADSRRALIGDVVRWAQITYVPEQLANRLADQARTTPAYLGALAAWRSCMAGRGFSFATPDAAHDALSAEFAREGATAGFRQREVSVASADGECSAEVHLPLTAARAARELVGSLSPDERSSLAGLAADRDAAVERAHGVLGK